MEKKTKILVVDDEPTLCATFEKGLGKLGYWVDSAHNADKALDKLTSFEPHLMLLDIRMPRIWGDDILKTIKDQRPETKIIIITGVVDEVLHEKCLNKGAYAVIKKPIDFKFLHEKILEALNLKEAS